MIYLDHAATTPVPRAVADAMYEVLTEQFGNPSSQYPMGLEMKRRVEVWRKTVADALGCGAKQLFFTSCGTEADNWAVTAACWQNRHLGRHIVTTAVEHSAVLEACRWMERQGYEVTYLVPAQDGSLSAEQVLAAVRQDTALVSCMLVNNELGNIYPIAEIARGLAVKNPQTLLHTDAVQGFLKVPCSAKTLGADFLTISAHKIGGPKGIGALYIGPRVRNPKPLLACFGIAGATAVIVGKRIGEGAGREEVYSLGCCLLTVSFGVGLVVSVCLAVLLPTVFIPYLYPLFHLEGLALEIAVTMCVVYLFMLPLKAFDITNITGLLRAGGDSRMASIIDLSCQWVIAVPLTFLTALVFNAPVAVVCLCIQSENVCKCPWGILRLRSRKWINDVTGEDT